MNNLVNDLLLLSRLESDALTKTVLADYHTCVFSRSISELSFYDVLSKNRAQFAIVGDGKELPQIALAKQFKNGDWRAGYYRDQTLAMAAGFATPFQLFTQLYANTAPHRNRRCRFLRDHSRRRNFANRPLPHPDPAHDRRNLRRR